MKRLVTWLVLGGLLACFAVPAYISIANGNLTGPVREQVIIWLLFAAPWFFAAWLLVNAWWNSSGQRLSTMDNPARLLAVAVGAMPETRKELHLGMTGGQSRRDTPLNLASSGRLTIAAGLPAWVKQPTDH